MNRFCWILVLCVLFVCFLQVPTYAADTAKDYVNDTIEEFGSEIEEAIPDETKEDLEQLGLDELSLQQLLSLETDKFIYLLKDMFSEQCQTPKKTLLQLIAMLLLCSLLFPLKASLLKGGAADIFTLVVLLMMSLILTEPLQNCMAVAVKAMEYSANFLLSLLPILCGLLVVEGQAATASSYHLLLFALCQLISQLAAAVLLPLLRIYYAFSIVAGIFPELGLQGIVDGIKRFVCWGLGFLTTIFVGILSLQTFVTSSVDAVTLKTSRFLMGSFIPVVGSILSEAFGAAQGCISLIKGTVGSFGIIAALCMVLPTLVKILLWFLTLWIVQQFSSLLQLKEVTSLLKGGSSILSLLLSFLLSFMLLLIVGTSLVIFVGSGGK